MICGIQRCVILGAHDLGLEIFSELVSIASIFAFSRRLRWETDEEFLETLSETVKRRCHLSQGLQEERLRSRRWAAIIFFSTPSKSLLGVSLWAVKTARLVFGNLSDGIQKASSLFWMARSFLQMLSTGLCRFSATFFAEGQLLTFLQWDRGERLKYRQNVDTFFS